MVKAILDTSIEIKYAKHYSKYYQANSSKINRHSKQNSYHVTNENIASSEVTDNVGDKRGDAFWGIPKLSCLGICSDHDPNGPKSLCSMSSLDR